MPRHRKPKSAASPLGHLTLHQFVDLARKSGIVCEFDLQPKLGWLASVHPGSTLRNKSSKRTVRVVYNDGKLVLGMELGSITTPEMWELVDVPAPVPVKESGVPEGHAATAKQKKKLNRR